MKHLKLIILIIGVSIFFFGCSKDNSLAPNQSQNDDVTSTYKAKKVHTHFAGTSVPFPNLDNPNENRWYDEADDWRVTGISIWVADPMIPINESTFELGGTAVLFVDAPEDDDPIGKWETTWWGTMTFTSPDGSTFRIVAHAVGIGVEGEVEGLTARWKYTMDFDGSPETLMYVTKGKITETL